MRHAAQVYIRPMTLEDLARLPEIDANFESPVYLDVVKEIDGMNVSWRLFQRPLDPPFVCTDFVFDEQEQRRIDERLRSGDGLWLVTETRAAGQPPDAAQHLIGMVDVEREAWRKVGLVWNIAIDRAYRGQGWGHKLMQRVIKWGRRQGLRAIVLETQTNNWPACLFYRHLGFQLSGFDDHYYTNHDLLNKEMALFWTYEL